MKIETKFDVGQNVKIKELNMPARIIEIIISGNDLIYKVQYWLDGKIEYVNLSEEELS